MIKVATLRSDLAPIPETLEAEIRIDDELKQHLVQGKVILVSGNETPHRIIKVESINNNFPQSDRLHAYIRITSLMDSVHALSFVRKTGAAVIKNNASLGDCYRACGATNGNIKNAPSIPRFSVLAGDAPTFQVAKVIQEAGGGIRAKDGKLEFMRLKDMIAQKPAFELSDSGSAIDSGFLERHEVPVFYSLDPSGNLIYGNQEKARSARFAPNKTLGELRQMSMCLVKRKTAVTGLNMQLAAGDTVRLADGSVLAIITVAHVFGSGTDNSGVAQYSRLWLGSVEGA